MNQITAFINNIFLQLINASYILVTEFHLDFRIEKVYDMFRGGRFYDLPAFTSKA